MTRIHRDSETVLEQLAAADLCTAAYYLVYGIADGAYSVRSVFALMLFTTVPCPETGAVLVASCPAVLDILMTPHDQLMDDLQHSGPEFEVEDYDGWMRKFDVNQRASDGIYRHLTDGMKNHVVTVDFDPLGSRQLLHERLSVIGLQKGFLQRRTTFLTDCFVNDRRAFNVALDLIGIRCATPSGLRYWSAVGEQSGPQRFALSEIQYNLGDNGEPFCGLVDTLRATGSDDA